MAVLENFSDFIESPTEKGVYVKQVGINSSIRMTMNDIYNENSSIENYKFPEISIEVDGTEYSIFRETDLTSFLFLPGVSFMFFYNESHYLEIGENHQLLRVIRKLDEPVIYNDEANSQYVVSNSTEKLISYNKYIHLVFKLYAHYFRVFEKWLVTQLGKKN